MAEVEKVDRGARRKARTRKKLLDAASELCTEKPLEEISIVDITEAADVGLGTFYNHFESKQELLKALADEFLHEYETVLDSMVADLTDPAEIFLVSYRFTVRCACDERGWHIIRQMPHNYVRERLEERSMADMKMGQASGRFQVPNEVSMGQFLNCSVVGIMWGVADKDVTLEHAQSYAVYFLQLLGLDSDEIATLMAKDLPA
jgi:AcrR family transcriptional regulator